MHFPGRDLPLYSEAVPEAEMVQGEVYYRVAFYDADSLAPQVEPLVFIGKDLTEPPDGQGLYFQDIPSYLAGVRWGSENASEATFHQQKHGILDFERALDVLLRCSLRRTAEPHLRIRPIQP